jgi:hypothetical protein
MIANTILSCGRHSLLRRFVYKLFVCEGCHVRVQLHVHIALILYHMCNILALAPLLQRILYQLFTLSCYIASDAFAHHYVRGRIN